jgi:isopenicillin-N epimerase
VFLNHGSFGACPRPVFETYQRLQRDLERNPVEFLGRRLPELLAAARARLAEYLNAALDDLVFVPNATSGLNVVARSLRLEPGDEVVTTDHEYGAADLLWEHVCGRAGARYVRRPIPVPVRSAEEVVDAVWAGVTDRTRVLFLSHITSPTALVLPVEELCKRARQAGIIAVVDGAHAPGQLPVDLSALGADAYAGNCHKWLCAPKGAGFLWVRPAVQPRLDSLIVGWGWAEDDASFVTRNERQGTRDPAAYLAVPAALDFLADWEAIRDECHQLARTARILLAELTGEQPIQPDSSAWFRQMVSALLPDGIDSDELGLRLARDHGIEVGARPWGSRPMIRLSFQGYNSTRDLDRLLEVLPRVLRDCR